MKKQRIIKSLVITSAVIIMILTILLTVCLTGSGYNDKLIAGVSAISHNPKVGLSEVNGIKTFTKDSELDFRILQLTDIHIGNGILSKKNDEMAISAIYSLVRLTQPDLIVLTGDSIYPTPFVSGTNNNLKEAKVIGSLMESFKIPWTLVYGNHDSETYATHEKDDLSDYYESLEYCLFERGPADITGMGNYIINVNNNDNTLNTSLVFIDSNMYAKGGYDRIHDDQLDWYENKIKEISEGRPLPVPSLMFLHIPFEEYSTAWDLYKEFSSEVTYHYGEKRENVCYPAENASVFNRIVELGSTKGVFCGHDHVNDYSITYRGVRLTYGKSIDYLAYKGIAEKTEQRGGTVIEINNDGSFAVTPITLANIG